MTPRTREAVIQAAGEAQTRARGLSKVTPAPWFVCRSPRNFGEILAVFWDRPSTPAEVPVGGTRPPPDSAVGGGDEDDDEEFVGLPPLADDDVDVILGPANGGGSGTAQPSASLVSGLQASRSSGSSR